MGGGGCYHCNYLWTSNATVILIFISFCSLQDQFKLGGGGGGGWGWYSDLFSFPNPHLELFAKVRVLCGFPVFICIGN